jgi:AraC-like DNA-binding protein
MRSALRLAGAEAAGLEALYRRIRSIPPAAQANLIALLELFGNYIAYAQSRLLLLKQPRDSQVVAHAKDCVREGLAEPLSLDQVAAAAFTSKRNLTRVFLRETGETVLGFIHRSRIEDACRRLLAGEENCLRIAGRCGFGSVQQFNRVFRKLKGLARAVGPPFTSSGAGQLGAVEERPAALLPVHAR